MKFGGYRACSLIDFPGKVSAVFFTQGCSFRCPFCHNPKLVLPHTSPLLSEEVLLDFLRTRQGKLDGVVVSGGEPTIHKELPPFIKKIKDLGFLVKLDTNASNPTMIEFLLHQNLIDYWAVDNKASFQNYPLITKSDINIEQIKTSFQLILQHAQQYEFRTTVLREFHPPAEIEIMAHEIAGAQKYILQQFRPDTTLDLDIKASLPYRDDEMEFLCSLAREHVQECFWR
jgi:pyruvate formate lyase activating enzyme